MPRDAVGRGPGTGCQEMLWAGGQAPGAKRCCGPGARCTSPRFSDRVPCTRCRLPRAMSGTTATAKDGGATVRVESLEQDCGLAQCWVCAGAKEWNWRSGRHAAVKASKRTRNERWARRVGRTPRVNQAMRPSGPSRQCGKDERGACLTDSRERMPHLLQFHGARVPALVAVGGSGCRPRNEAPLVVRR